MGAVAKQWDIYPNGKYKGLNFHAVELAAKWMGVEITPELFEKIHHYEREWCNAIAAVTSTGE